MQACEVCGWDTREGTRVCPSCRAQQQQPPDAADPGVLAGVLRTVRDMSMDAGDADRPTPAGQPPSTTSRRPRGPRRDDDGSEQVVLREIEPGGDDQPRPAAASSVAASLLEAFQLTHDPSTPPAAPPSQPEGRPATAVEGDAPAPAEIAAGVDRPPDAAVPPAGDRVDAMDVTDRLTALVHPPAGDEVDDSHSIQARSADEADTAGTMAPLTDARPGAEPRARSWGPDDPGPITDRFANIPTVPMEPGPASEPSVGAPADDVAATDATPVPVDAIGDTTVPPAPIREDTVVDAPIGQGATPSAHGAEPSAQTAATADALPPTADRPPAQAGTAQQEAPDAPAWRAALREAGTWTTVAQFTLLFMGMLCVFQVVVLLVVSQFLAQNPQAAAPDMLAAHAKVATVMLPALVGGAFATAVFAAWRAYTDPRERDDTSWLRRRLGDLPIAVWAVFGAATLLLLVVLLGTSATVAEARRMTWWAIGACSLLGIACVAAPRGLATQEADDGAEASAPVGERVSA